MKNVLPLSLVFLVLSFSGCAWVHRHTPWHHGSTGATATTNAPAGRKAPAKNQTIVTPDESLAAKVITVNAIGRFVVLNFPEGNMPKLDQHLFLYRGGLKTAEVKVVGPRQDTSIVADIISGDAQTGDTVRDQ